MNKSTKWIVVGLVAVFIGLVVATQLLNQKNYTFSSYDTTTIISADDQSGGFEETISGDINAPAKLVVYTDYQIGRAHV